MKLKNNLRQLKYIKEYRISSHTSEDESFTRDDLLKIEKLAQTLSEQMNEKNNEFDLSLFTDIITGLWRTRNSLVKPGLKEPAEENRMTFRHLQSVWDILVEKGFNIIDHIGEPVQGRSLNVLTFEPMKDIKEEKVIETIKPTIYYKDELIQIADVIVGTPKE